MIIECPRCGKQHNRAHTRLYSHLKCRRCGAKGEQISQFGEWLWSEPASPHERALDAADRRRRAVRRSLKQKEKKHARI